MFGRGTHGAVSLIYAKDDPDLKNQRDQKVNSMLGTRASIPGMQPKTLAIEKNGKLDIAAKNNISTHIIKFNSSEFRDIVENEYMSIEATKALLPEDKVVNAELKTVRFFDKSGERVITIERFDRNKSGGRIHFEEAAQVLGYLSVNRDKGSMEEYGEILEGNQKRIFFSRVLSQLMIGNVDMHMKNIGFFVLEGGKLEQTPMYDLVNSVNRYGYESQVDGELRFKVSKNNLNFAKVNAKSVFNIGKDIGLSLDEIKEQVDTLRIRLPIAMEKILNLDIASSWNMDKNEPYISTNEREKFKIDMERNSRKMYAGFDKFYEILKKKEERYFGI